MSDQSVVDDAKAIWQAGVDAVAADRLIEQALWLDDETQDLIIGGERIPLDQIGRIFVGGAGKASGWMARAVEKQIEPILNVKKVSGWVNVPDGQVIELRSIKVYGARLKGSNLPESRTVDCTRDAIVEPMSELEANDLFIFLVSGGGSALLEVPAKGLRLNDICETTTALTEAGANIYQLNTVRKCMSDVKGGKLARQCKAKIISLIISDVMGSKDESPEETIDLVASGPTVLDSPADPAAAIAVLDTFPDAPISRNVRPFLEKLAAEGTPAEDDSFDASRVKNVLIGDNKLAVSSSEEFASGLGYQCECVANQLEGDVVGVAQELATKMTELIAAEGAVCFISGGEPTVTIEGKAGRGGRNQHLVLAAMLELMQSKMDMGEREFCLLSGGTDGEDGNVAAAGSWIDHVILADMNLEELQEHFKGYASYKAFKDTGNLLKVGPTRTNVSDLRILIAR